MIAGMRYRSMVAYKSNALDGIGNPPGKSTNASDSLDNNGTLNGRKREIQFGFV